MAKDTKTSKGRGRSTLQLVDTPISAEDFQKEFVEGEKEVPLGEASADSDMVGSLSSAAHDLSETLRSTMEQERRLRNEIKNIKTRNEDLERDLKASQYRIKSLQTQLEQATARHEQLLKRYDELLRTSQSELTNIESARQHLESTRRNLESELEVSKTQISDLTIKIKSFETEQRDGVIRREQYDALLVDVQRQEYDLSHQVLALQGELDNVTAKLHDALKGEAKSQLERAAALASMRRIAETSVFQSVQLTDARDQLNSSIRVMEGLLRSMKQRGGDLEINDAKGGILSKKVRSLLAEQWKMEIDNLRRLDVLLAEIVASAKNLKELN